MNLSTSEKFFWRKQSITTKWKNSKLCSITASLHVKIIPHKHTKEVNMRSKRTNPEEMLERTSIIFMFLCAISWGVYWDVPQTLSTTKKVGTVVFPSINGNQTCFFHMPAEKNQTNQTKLEQASNCSAAKPAAQETWPRLGKCFVENGSRFECTTNASAWQPPNSLHMD